MRNVVIIRRPTDDEQRNAKIVTSDYAISGITIHSSVLKTLGWIDKVYRSKQCTLVYSNKKEIKHVRKQLESIVNVLSSYTPYNLYILKKEADKYTSFKNEIEYAKKWVDVKSEIPYFVAEYGFKTPKSLYRILKRTDELYTLFEGILDGINEMKYDKENNFKTLFPQILNYLEKIETNSERGHTQTLIWNKAYKAQQRIENELGKNFTPQMYGLYVDDYRRNLIINEWHIDLASYKGTWEDLCNYLYSPKMMAEIRNKIGVEVRAREKSSTRKGVESMDKKKFAKIIENNKRIVGNDFNLSEEEQKIKEAKKNLELKENQYEEGKWVLKHAINNNANNINELSKAVEKLRQKYNYARKQYEKLCSTLNRKKEALDIIREYEKKMGILNEFIEETRSGEEISSLEQEEIVEAIRKQKAENQIPYYTWRFVCDKIDKETASKIEEALEENLNKGNGVNGEDGYINVTAFPMTKSYEFFVDYPKNSNLFRAFKNKGIELSNILIDGVAKHLKMSFVSPKGEMFINNPMEKTLSGDMLEWVGL